MITSMLRWFAPILLAFLVLALSGCSDEKPDRPDSYAVLDLPMPNPVELPPAALVLVELVEVRGQVFDAWIAGNTIDPTRANPMRRAVQDWVLEENARVLETSIVNARSGERGKTSSVREIIRPAEYRYPVVTKTIEKPAPEEEEGNEQKKKGSGENEKPKVIRETVEEVIRNVAPIGHVFETREVGFVLEVQVTVEPGSPIVDVVLAPEFVQYFENLDWEARSGDDVESFTTPVFEKNTLRTSVTLQSGVYGLLGVGRVPGGRTGEGGFDDSLVLFFIRADSNQTEISP